MLRLWSPVLLVVLSSCQFGAADREVELLPTAQESETRAPSATHPVAEVGAPSATVEEALALRLAEQAARATEAREEADRLRKLALEAEEAKAAAEQELLTAQAALQHERSARAELEQEREFLLRQIGEVQDQLLEAEAESAEMAALQGRLEQLELELYEARVYEPTVEGLDLSDALRAVQYALAEQGAGDGLEFFTAGGDPGLRLSGKILFPSGHTELDEEGAALLAKLAADLAPLAESGAQIQVVGHTDDQPIRQQAERFPLGNVQLSCQRALVVAEALADAGVARESLTVSGMGPLQPLLPNDTEEHRARNRRGEILLRMPAVTAVGGEAEASQDEDSIELEPGLR